MSFRIIFALAFIVALGVAGLYGYKKGRDDDRARSNLVIAKMVIKAKEDVEAASKENERLSRELLATKEKAQNDLQTEIERNNRWRHSADAGSRLMREQLADFARGADAANDSVTACRADAEALGLSLEAALRASAVCAGDAEEASASTRTMLASWPRVVR